MSPCRGGRSGFRRRPHTDHGVAQGMEIPAESIALVARSRKPGHEDGAPPKPERRRWSSARLVPAEPSGPPEAVGGNSQAGRGDRERDEPCSGKTAPIPNQRSPSPCGREGRAPPSRQERHAFPDSGAPLGGSWRDVLVAFLRRCTCAGSVNSAARAVLRWEQRHPQHGDRSPAGDSCARASGSGLGRSASSPTVSRDPCTSSPRRAGTRAIASSRATEHPLLVEESTKASASGTNRRAPLPASGRTMRTLVRPISRQSRSSIER